MGVSWFCVRAGVGVAFGFGGDMSESENQLERLLEIMRRLRGRGVSVGSKQSSDSIKMYAIEEAYEVVEAIESGSVSFSEEELGDLLLRVVFHAQMQSEAGRFDFEDVARGISDKLVRRHPHVFGERSWRMQMRC